MKIAVFCIPAHGHTNPTLPVVRELVCRGHEVRYYSFEEFRSKIIATGADFISCDRFLGELTKKEEAALKRVSTTEMTIQDIRITIAMDAFLEEEFKSWQPDVVYTDSVCFWGKLNAMKHDVPMVVSTSTFAFNQMSSKYMKNSPKEMLGLILGLGQVNREMDRLKPLGYQFKSFLSLVQSDNDTDTVVYTSRGFQPCVESFSSRYCFVGPSLWSERERDKQHRPLVYISLGTVINDRPDFYGKCIEALKDEDVDVIISCGKTVDPASLGKLPEHVKIYDRVDQLEVLSRANVFITHCGMNSVSESLYMATPMVLYPQTNEQEAVARRVREIGAGIDLKNVTAEGICAAVRTVLDTESYAKGAWDCSDEFRSCSGPAGAADFIEQAPHTCNEPDILKLLTKANVKWQVLYNAAAILGGNVLFRFVDVKFLWIYILAAILLSAPVNSKLQEWSYKRLIADRNKPKTGERE